ncbi:MAG: hypothetical protein AAGK10_22500, partial [Cyanobacteria bacterium J06555_3]
TADLYLLYLLFSRRGFVAGAKAAWKVWRSPKTVDALNASKTQNLSLDMAPDTASSKSQSKAD